MAAYAALVSLINNIDQITNHPTLSNCFVKQQMESLLQKAASLLDFIEQGYHHQDLEREITSAAHAAEDVVESHVVDQIHAETLLSVDLQQVIQDLGAVAGKAMEVKEKQGVREKEEEQPPTHPTPDHVGETAMVGLDDELTQLLDSLTNDRSNRHVISIVGMGGTGKTTLAQNLYAHQLVKEHFDIRGWATISHQYKLLDILSQLLISCKGKFTKGNVGELGEQLHKTLYGRRYLIVLDDIWGVEAWDGVRRYLPDSGNSSRVVLTTRSSKVANDCGSTCFDLNILDEGKSWDLFCNKAMFPFNEDPPQLEDVAKEIVKQCKGLALSIVVIGGLLVKSPRTLEYWKGVLKGLGTSDSKEKQQGLDALSLSYNHLPPHLKPCFLYMGTFDEDSRIRASNITRLWVAEGFIKPKGNRDLEEIAEDHLKDLSDRNLVLGLERGFTGKIKSFSIHDLLRDLCIKVGEQQEFFRVRRANDESQDRALHRIFYKPYIFYESGFTLARSVLGQNYDIDYVKYKLLRVFDATENDSPEDVYGSNVNLRYLVHKEFSPNVYLVWNLQTLIIKQTYGSPLVVVAPVGIWKMRHLRHVKGDRVHIPSPPPPQRRYGVQYRMEKLQTLKRAVNLRLSEETCEMIPNIKKLGLTYDPDMQGYDVSLIECLPNLDRFHKLESLSMDIVANRWQSSKLALPLSLKKLCLSKCYLSCEEMSVIGSLPQLQLLHLGPFAAMEGHVWSPVGRQFRRLKFLEIESCDLVSWDADSSHFPVLEKLFLRQVSYLKEIPLEIGEIPTLGLIRVNSCCESAAVSAVKIKKDQLENYDNDALQIEIEYLFESRIESFKKRMEEEELPLNLFKIKCTY